MAQRVDELLQSALAGDPGALARALSVLERGGEHAQTLRAMLEHAHRDAPRALVVGLTGAPGSGKSTLAAGLAREWRSRQRRVAVLAFDPSSARSGGAVLGDRIRMQSLVGDPGVFVRSMAARGQLGGLSAAAPAAVALLARSSADVVLVETVGVGQSEADIVQLADVVVLLHNPEAGDDIQAVKAGLTELADLHVLNKADLPGAARARRTLQELTAAPSDDRPVTHVLSSTATTGEGIAELADAIEALGAQPTPARSGARGSQESAILEAASRRLVAVLASSDGKAILAAAKDGSSSMEEATEALLELAARTRTHRDAVSSRPGVVKEPRLGE